MQFIEVPIPQIEETKTKHRDITRNDIETLCLSITNVGLLQPLVIGPKAGKVYPLIAGMRRLTALKELGRKHAPCVIVTDGCAEGTEPASLQTLAENFQRKDLQPMQELHAFEILLAGKYGVAQIAAIAGRSEPYVRARLALTNLTKESRKAYDEGKINLTQAIILSHTTSAALQADWLKHATQYGWDANDMKGLLTGWNHDGFGWPAKFVKACKKCILPQPTLFDDMEDISKARCFDSDHLVKTQAEYVKQIMEWASGENIEVEIPAHSWESREYKALTVRTGLPLKVPKDTKKIVAAFDRVLSDDRIVGWYALNATYIKKQSDKETASDSESTRVKTPDQNRQEGAQKAVDRFMTASFAEIKEITAPTVSQGVPLELIAYTLLCEIDWTVRNDIYHNVLGVDTYLSNDNMYSLLVKGGHKLAVTVIAKIVQTNLQSSTIPVMGDVLRRFFNRHPAEEYVADEVDLKALKKDVLLTLDPAQKQTVSKKELVEHLTGRSLMELAAWPELAVLLTVSPDGMEEEKPAKKKGAAKEK